MVVDFLKKHKMTYIIGMILMGLSSYIQTLMPKVLGQIIDLLSLESIDFNKIYMNILYMILIAIAIFITSYKSRSMIIESARKFEVIIREKLFEHFENMDSEFYNERKTGDLIAYAINDISAVRIALGPATARGVGALALAVISIQSMINTINLKVTIITLSTIPIVLILMIFISTNVRKRFKVVQRNFASISGRVDENINGIRVIKAYAQEDEEVKKFEKLNNKMADSNINMVRVSSFMNPIIQICFAVSFSVSLIFGGNMVLRGELTLGDFTAFNGYITMLMAPVMFIGRILNIVQRGSASMNRLNEILNCKKSINDDKDAMDKHIHGKIDIKDLSFRYPNTDDNVLKNINLSINKGETIGIIGKTGSGKTTLINLLLRIYDPGDNEIFYDGIDIKKHLIKNIREEIGFVPQDNFLFSASIYDNIKFFNDKYTDEEAVNAAKNACIYDSINKLEDGFNTILGERGVNISGGQKQRLSIARALIKNPNILILDDSLSAVDTITEKNIINNLKDNRKGKTTIVIAHRISAIMNSDKIVVLDNGEIVEVGTHDELIKREGIYYDIFKSQEEKEECYK